MRMTRLWTAVTAAAALVGSFVIGAAPASAAQTDADTITITGDVTGRTFTAYELGAYNDPVVQGGTVESVNFTQNASWNNPSIAQAAGSVPASYNGNELAYMATLNETTDGAKLRQFAQSLASAETKPAAAGTATITNGKAKFSGLTPGYYLIVDSDGVPILVGTAISANGTVYTTLAGQQLGTAYAKPNTPAKPGKTVTGATDGTVTKGDLLNYEVTAIVPGTAGNATYHMALKDTASKGLTVHDDSFVVTIDDVPFKNFTVTPSKDESGTTTTIIDLGDVKGQDGKTVRVSYTATVNADAVDTITNSASVAHDDEYVADSDPVTVKTYGFRFTKTDASGKELRGAEFTISGTNIDDLYTDPVVKTSDTDGSVQFTGLAEGTYTVEETKVPNGYLQNVHPRFTVTVAKDGTVTFHEDDAWGLLSTDASGTHVKVKNVTAITQLPLTGAAGIGMIIAIAVLLAAAGTLIGMRTRAMHRQMID